VCPAERGQDGVLGIDLQNLEGPDQLGEAEILGQAAVEEV
jgi:hypothetical protein